jgi:very-long-chain enoyl-CoA reductase
MLHLLCLCRCHIILANLRKPGEKAYKIPTGFLFNYITCANYTAEIWGWILFTIGTRTLAAGLFTAAGAFQMAEWARGKHKRLVKVGCVDTRSVSLCCVEQ